MKKRDEAHSCKRCGRELKTKRSIERGYGLVCWRRLEPVKKLDAFDVALILAKRNAEILRDEPELGVGDCAIQEDVDIDGCLDTADKGTEDADR